MDSIQLFGCLWTVKVDRNRNDATKHNRISIGWALECSKWPMHVDFVLSRYEKPTQRDIEWFYYERCVYLNRNSQVHFSFFFLFMSSFINKLSAQHSFNITVVHWDASEFCKIWKDTQTHSHMSLSIWSTLVVWVYSTRVSCIFYILLFIYSFFFVVSIHNTCAWACVTCPMFCL